MDISEINSEQELLAAARRQAEEADGIPDDPDEEEAWITAFLDDEAMQRIGVKGGWQYKICPGLILEIVGCFNQSRLEGPDPPQPSGKHFVID
ncbi:hypothetical protein KKC88_03020 [Patescibacteria group bacterium]|nr:hypothetical protein [Patescibacteria group bacterium]MBU1673469.1 hypothetical protein [Patescibacteria group bacterium]MBU1962909.1 hypothetical protein [Patescibacteria group bacterium]